MPEKTLFTSDFKTVKELPADLSWENEPENWNLGGNGLKIHPEGKTDFWQRTHYGMQNDNGHFLKIARKENKFSLTTRVRYRSRNEFDQAGLMVRITPQNWIKTSVEFQPDAPDKLSVVVTNLGYSDWSCQDFTNPDNEIILRIKAERPDFIIEYKLPGSPENWTLIRIAHLHTDHPDIPIQAGIYCCSPGDEGFQAEFDYLEICQIT